MCCFEATLIGTFVDVRMGKSSNYRDIGDWLGSARTRPFHHQERKKERMVNGCFAGDCFICCLGLNTCCSYGRWQWYCWYLFGAIANHPCINHGILSPIHQVNKWTFQLADCMPTAIAPWIPWYIASQPKKRYQSTPFYLWSCAVCTIVIHNDMSWCAPLVVSPTSGWYKMGNGSAMVAR